MRRRRRVTYRPNKGQSVFAGIVGLIFVGIGLIVVIPAFGPFGILWTLIAVGSTVMSFYQALCRFSYRANTSLCKSWSTITPYSSTKFLPLS